MQHIGDEVTFRVNGCKYLCRGKIIKIGKDRLTVEVTHMDDEPIERPVKRNVISARVEKYTAVNL